MNDRRTALEASISESKRELKGELDRECLAFSAYLIRQRPNGYVMAKYRDAHDTSGIVELNGLPFLDRFLVGVAAAHPVGAKLVDAYTAVFCKRSAVRRKWILLLAILESCAPTYKYFDLPDSGGRFTLASRLLWQGLGFILAFILSVILFMPAHLISAVFAKRAGRP
ncbi:MAG TPA: hypothetical protein VJ810_26080 [Blastocatellia bacterium]|nr:hypothetical protein [Blastocatellia bacterium]